MKHHLLKKFFSFSIGNWIGIIISFISTPIITYFIVPAEFGKASIFTIALNILLLFSIFGLDESFVRFFYSEKENNRNFLLYRTLKISVFISLFLAFVILLFWRQISNLLFSEIFFLPILILVLCIIFGTLERYMVLFVRMQQKGWTFSCIGLINKILVSVGAILFCLFVKKDFTAIIFAQLLSSVFTVLLVVIFEYKKLFDFVDINYKQIQHTYKEIFLYAIPFVPSYLFYWILQSGDRVFIKKLSNLNELGVYSLAAKFISILLIFQTSFTTFWVPLALERFHKDPEDKEFFLKVFNIVAFLMILILILIILFKDLIIFILPKSYSGISFLIPLLVFMPLMSTLCYITGLGINFYKKTKIYFLIIFCSSLVSLILNYFLISRLGAKGAALTNAIVYIFYFYLLTFVSFKYFDFRLNLKKYSIIFLLLFMYAFYSSFYAKITGNIIGGIIFVFIVIIWNLPIIKEYKKLILH